MTAIVRALAIVVWFALVAKTILNWASKHDMSVYAENAGPTLMGLLSRASELSKSRVSIEAEIAIVRATMARLVDMWAKVLDKADAPQELLLHCESVIRETADLIARLVNSDARTRVLDEGAIQLSSVSYVVGEVSRAIEETIREKNPDMADHLVARIGKIRLPEDGTVSKFINKARDEAFL